MVQLNQWMKEIPDSTRISTLSIPGTHNSAAFHTALPSVQCQGASISSQLSHGIRFLDVRVSRNFLTTDESHKNDLIVIHGKFPVKLLGSVKLSEVFTDVYNFLSANSSETVFVSIKQEGTGTWDNANDEFGTLIWDNYVSKNQDKWYLDTGIPQMSEARGKAIFFRRFGVNDENRKSHFGIDAASWSYNTTDDDRGLFCVQDWCEIQSAQDISKKASYIKEQLQRAVDFNRTSAATDGDGKLFINFCSGSNFFDHDCWPQRVAEGLEKDGIDQCFDKGAGIVVLDYAENNNWKLSTDLINKNF